MSNDVTYWKQGMCVRILEAMRADGDIEQLKSVVKHIHPRFSDVPTEDIPLDCPEMEALGGLHWMERKNGPVLKELFKQDEGWIHAYAMLIGVSTTIEEDVPKGGKPPSFALEATCNGNGSVTIDKRTLGTTQSAALPTNVTNLCEDLDRIQKTYPGKGDRSQPREPRVKGGGKTRGGCKMLFLCNGRSNVSNTEVDGAGFALYGTLQWSADGQSLVPSPQY